MAYFNKIGLLLLNEDRTQFMVCEKDNFTSDFIMPGGQVDEGENDEECLAREIKEELDVETDLKSLKFVGEYVDVASGDPTKDVSIKLYQGKIIGEPKPSQEIIGFKWIGKDPSTHERLSYIVKNRILPDLVGRGILK
jgi:ADP-ribose pyrophosphatase YjhB (NUDIX family)